MSELFDALCWFVNAFVQGRLALRHSCKHRRLCYDWQNGCSTERRPDMLQWSKKLRSAPVTHSAPSRVSSSLREWDWSPTRRRTQQESADDRRMVIGKDTVSLLPAIAAVAPSPFLRSVSAAVPAHYTVLGAPLSVSQRLEPEALSGLLRSAQGRRVSSCRGARWRLPIRCS
jgi:hypothetical protein